MQRLAIRISKQHHSHEHATSEHHHEGEHHHDHHDGSHGHSHGLVDPSIIRSRAGVKAVSLSFLVLFLTAILQVVAYGKGNSVALLTDLVHNMGDAMTALPLGIAFFLRNKKAERRSGYFVVFLILMSACIALYAVVDRFINPSTPDNLWIIFIAGLIGFLGNELAAIIRTRAGKKLNSPALIADGKHAHTDGLVSLGVIVSVIFIAVGLPIMDPIVGLVVSLLIVRVTWQSFKIIKES